ncbi:hypothetical protein D187_007516 [Cystobacter fuscus DSM 2262]|uniref:Uncharacterized protein n=1 Tax=Cystobacter fuscus (strain ATCC 25194 / DSM 2262 / NBRC 100088 / M29) TaxID=1242864 RepID=S9Q4E1_CYSF2|nr:hypothetical protein [Cystobacter fuscus]EPX56174.1 hypothetical protein D187_007516 [Cystobacter fuscus DSM 2262]
MRQSMKWLSAAAFLVLSGPTVMYAADLPAEKLTRDFINKGDGSRMWHNLYDRITNHIHAIWKKYGKGTMTPESEECLRQKLTEFHVKAMAPWMKGGIHSPEAVGEILHRLSKQGGERCPKGNPGLVAYQAWARDEDSKLRDERSALEKAVDEGVSAARDAMGRPLTPAEVAAIGAAIIFSAPVWALP